MEVNNIVYLSNNEMDDIIKKYNSLHFMDFIITDNLKLIEENKNSKIRIFVNKNNESLESISGLDVYVANNSYDLDLILFYLLESENSDCILSLI